MIKIDPPSGHFVEIETTWRVVRVRHWAIIDGKTAHTLCRVRLESHWVEPGALPLLCLDGSPRARWCSTCERKRAKASTMAYKAIAPKSDTDIIQGAELANPAKIGGEYGQ